MKPIIRDLNFMIFIISIIFIISCSPNEIPINPEDIQKYQIDSIEVFDVTGIGHGLYDTYRRNENIDFDSIVKSDGSVDYIILKKEYFNDGEDADFTANFKNRLLNECVYLAYYDYHDPAYDSDQYFLNSLKINRNINNQILDAKYYLYNFYEDSFSYILDSSSATKNFFISNTTNKIDSIIVSNIVSTTMPDYYSDLNIRYHYNNSLNYNAKLSGFDINNIINTFVFSSLTNEFNTNVAFSAFNLQKLVFSRNLLINLPSNILPTKIDMFSSDGSYSRSLDLSYVSNPDKDNRIESFFVGDIKYVVHYKP